MKNERGSIIVWVFIIMLLFSALSFVMMQGSRTSGSMVGKEEAKAYASQLISYGQSIKSASRRLQLRGCGDTRISFQNSISAQNYTNGTAPGDNSCHVFHQNGGGVTWFVPPSQMIDPAQNVSNAHFGVPFITGFANVAGIGTSCAAASCSDLFFIIADIYKSVCDEINIQLGLPAPIAEPITNYHPHSFAPTVFQGVYQYINAGSVLGDQMTALHGKDAGCFYSPESTTYAFYQVLIAR